MSAAYLRLPIHRLPNPRRPNRHLPIRAAYAQHLSRHRVTWPAQLHCHCYACQSACRTAPKQHMVLRTAAGELLYYPERLRVKAITSISPQRNRVSLRGPEAQAGSECLNTSRRGCGLCEYVPVLNWPVISSMQHD